MSIAARVATRYRIVKAFTFAEALEVFGYRRDERPTPEEVNSVYRKKIKDLMNENPDAIRDQEIMKPFNQAKDILTGQLQPDRDLGGYSPPPPPRRDTGPSRQDTSWADSGESAGNPFTNPKDREEKVTFEEARAKAKIPADVKWLFVTDTHRGQVGYMSDEFTSNTLGYVCCGETDSHWVLVAVQHHFYAAYVIGMMQNIDVWDINTFKYPKKAPVPTAAELYGNVKKVWKEFKHEMKAFNSKVIDARGWDFGKINPKGRLVTIKMLVSEITGVEFTGKVKVEIAYKRPPYGQDVPAGFWKSQYGSPHAYELIINGREYTLEVADIERLSNLRIKGKSFAKGVFGDYPEHSNAKDLSRNRDGKMILTYMAEKLAHLPDWVRSALVKAAEQRGAKTASYVYDRSFM